MHKYLIHTAIALSMICMCSISTAAEPLFGYIKGRVSVNPGQSRTGWLISFFDANEGPSPFTLEYWRKSDYREHTDADGIFSKQLPEGEYYIVALKKAKGNISGNPEEKDLIYPHGNDKKQKKYTVTAGKTTDIGIISSAVPFQKKWAPQGKTGIKGNVLDANGKPLEGKNVYFYPKFGKEIPLYGADNKTDKNGAYLVRVPEGGNYYLIVSGYRHPVAVLVKTGEITKGVEIRVPEM